MIRINSRSSSIPFVNCRILPAGSVRVATDLGFAQHERVVASCGPFMASLAQYAVVLTSEPCTGPIRLNGCEIPASGKGQDTYKLSFLRPGDRIEGVRLADCSYEMLLFVPGFVERYLEGESRVGSAAVQPLVRVEPGETILWLWRWLTLAAGREEEGVQQQSEITARLLIAMLVAHHGVGTTPERATCRHAIDLALRHIHDNLADALSVNALAQIAGLSSFHFCRTFKRATGLPVHQYIVEQRLLRARHLLEASSRPISAIALDAGFASQSHMNSSFRRRFATTPRAWRAAHRSEAARAAESDKDD